MVYFIDSAAAGKIMGTKKKVVLTQLKGDSSAYRVPCGGEGGIWASVETLVVLDHIRPQMIHPTGGSKGWLDAVHVSPSVCVCVWAHGQCPLWQKSMCPWDSECRNLKGHLLLLLESSGSWYLWNSGWSEDIPQGPAKSSPLGNNESQLASWINSDISKQILFRKHSITAFVCFKTSAVKRFILLKEKTSESFKFPRVLKKTKTLISQHLISPNSCVLKRPRS